jgi:hypothetical protein
MYNKNQTWHAYILAHVEMAWLQVLTVVSPSLESDMKKCRHTGCNNHQYGVSGLYASPATVNHSHCLLCPIIFRSINTYSQSFVFITELLHDLSLLIWALLYVNHFMQLFCACFTIQIQRSDMGL